MIEATTVGLIQETQCQWFEPKRLRALLLTVDGAGSGIDADKLDGQEGAYYLPAASYTAADVLTKLLTVDGAGSGLDADLLDGQHASDFVEVAGDTMTGTLVINSPGALSVAANADVVSIVGKLRVGNTNYAGWMALAQHDNSGTGNYALMQNSSGRTLINAATGQWIAHRINNADIMYMDATGLRVGSGTAPAYTLDVTGTMRVSGNVGFFSVTPAARPAAYTQTYSTADRTIAARTAAAITNNTGGTVSTTFAAITAGAAYAQADMTAVKNALASIADQFNKLRNDHLDTTQGLNSVIDDGQTLGLLQ